MEECGVVAVVLVVPVVINQILDEEEDGVEGRKIEEEEMVLAVAAEQDVRQGTQEQDGTQVEAVTGEIVEVAVVDLLEDIL